MWISHLFYGIYLYHHLVLKGVTRLFKSWNLAVDDYQFDIIEKSINDLEHKLNASLKQKQRKSLINLKW
jgi:hypothetical protein